MNPKTLGVLLVLCASFFWAVQTIVVKFAFRETAGVLQTAFFQVFFVSLLALLYAVFSKASFKIERNQWPAIVYIALAGSLVADFLFLYALTDTTAVNANLIAHLQPVFIILMGFFILKSEKISRFDYLGVFFMLLSALLVTSGSIENLFALKFGGFADLVVLVAAVIWATVTIAVKKYLDKVHAGVILFYRFLISAACFFAILVFSNNLFFSNYFQIINGLLVGAGYILLYEGLKRLKAAETSALELASPFFAAILGIAFLGEFLSPLQAGGMLLLFFGIYFISKK